MSAMVTSEVPTTRRTLVTETVLVLGVSLGASAVWSLLSLVDKLTQHVALNHQTTAMNSSVTPDRPWLDLTYQLVGIVIALVPVALALHLLTRDRADARHAIGFDLREPGRDLVRGLALAAAVGVPGPRVCMPRRAPWVSTPPSRRRTSPTPGGPSRCSSSSAAQNAVLEEVVMVGYLFTRWRRAGWSVPAVVLVSAMVRGSYHLYQGFGGFAGNLVMGVLFGWVYLRTRRVGPLVVAHTVLDVVAFVGYALLKGHLSWLG